MLRNVHTHTMGLLQNMRELSMDFYRWSPRWTHIFWTTNLVFPIAMAQKIAPPTRTCRVTSQYIFNIFPLFSNNYDNVIIIPNKGWQIHWWNSTARAESNTPSVLEVPLESEASTLGSVQDGAPQRWRSWHMEVAINGRYPHSWMVYKGQLY